MVSFCRQKFPDLLSCARRRMSLACARADEACAAAARPAPPVVVDLSSEISRAERAREWELSLAREPCVCTGSMMRLAPLFLLGRIAAMANGDPPGGSSSCNYSGPPSLIYACVQMWIPISEMCNARDQLCCSRHSFVETGVVKARPGMSLAAVQAAARAAVRNSNHTNCSEIQVHLQGTYAVSQVREQD